MVIKVTGSETFLYMCGLSIDAPLYLSEGLELSPAHCEPNPDDIIHACINKPDGNEIDLGIAVIFLRMTSSQLRITANTPRELAIRAWNSQHDIILLSAILNCPIEFALQCNQRAEVFCHESILNVVHYHIHIPCTNPHHLNQDEVEWISEHFEAARKLMDNEQFYTAVISLWSYRWHTRPSMQLAILWAGIEALFGLTAELSFRLKLYISKFLSNGCCDEDKELFKQIGKLYACRSKAVHGANNRIPPGTVEASSNLLNRLIMRCIETNGLPPEEASLLF